MSTVLITGANRGLGLEFACQYQADGWTVVATCRDPGAAPDLAALGVEVLPLDVSDLGAVAAFGGQVGARPVDLFINNAGVYGGAKDRQSLGLVDAGIWADTLLVNTIAPLKLIEGLLPALQKGTDPKAVFLSSKMGSIAENSSGGAYIYRSSKAALNAVVKSLALDLAGAGIIAAALHPGWVRTDMGGPNGMIDAPESIAGMRAVIAGLTPAQAGGLYAYDGQEIPW